MWHCNNVDGLGEHVKKHVLWFFRYTFLHFLLYSSARAERANVYRKSPYLSRGLIDFDKIWHADAVRPYWASQQLKIWDRKLKFPTFKNPRWRTAAIMKNRNIAICQPWFERFWQNLALMSAWRINFIKLRSLRMSALSASMSNKNAALCIGVVLIAHELYRKFLWTAFCTRYTL